ncbi:branched-chain amino acid ABC transporter permease [Streptomyces sp. NPDC001380]|uniref:branched-chain amino acid ABC transporter permease n=1 Tax=Streptomyces sp. NPDC001380 TaxID=3364566 RepID=UPI00368AC952
MTNETTTGTAAGAPEAAPRTAPLGGALPPAAARALTTAGAAATIGSTLLAWTWTADFPGDLTYAMDPGGLQILTLAAGILTLLHAVASYGVRGLRWLAPTGTTSALRLLAVGGAATTWYTLVAISWELGGLANLEPGGWAAGVASLLPVIGALALPDDARPAAPPRALPSWAEILLIVAGFAAGLLVFSYGIDTAYGELFVGFLITVCFAATALFRSGLVGRLSGLTAKHRPVATAAAFAAAAGFPFTQTSDEYTSVAANILIFATVALGLNVVVGLAGLLDLGYVAFLGVGAYTAALVSGSTASPLHVHFPFWAAALAGAAASMVFGVLIGAPTLRLRGDYLAIVTLGFGEIFRIAMNNLDGTNGPDVTNGSNGIPNIPDLDILGFDFGRTHDLGFVTLGRFSNYYLLMLLFTAIVVTVFARSGNSRIGRAWVAIREDETAAGAMGINGFRLKLLAFALGASLAGLAGTVQAHVTYTVTPEQYQFAGSVPPNSAFLLAAVILGGMGTISGPLLGASLLYLIPKKLEFLQDYQLLLFGIALIILMRVRPEGLIASRRQKLEFHDEDPATGSGALDADPGANPGGPTAGLTKAGA